jgi:hypothetical protein
VQLHDAIGHVEHCRIVSGDDNGHSLRRHDVPEEPHDPAPRLQIQLARRLVGEEELGPGRQGAGDGDALLLAARELRGPVVRPAGEADEAEQLVDPAVALDRIGGEQPERDLDVLGGAQDGDEPEGLEDVGHGRPSQLALIAVAGARDVPAVDLDRPRSRPVQAPDEV